MPKERECSHIEGILGIVSKGDDPIGTNVYKRHKKECMKEVTIRNIDGSKITEWVPK